MVGCGGYDTVDRVLLPSMLLSYVRCLNRAWFQDLENLLRRASQAVGCVHALGRLLSPFDHLFTAYTTATSQAATAAIALA